MMPLHLLGKKSWNVYNADNIARVRRDEAEAKACEEAEEQRQQEIDADRRLAVLRGEVLLPLPHTEEEKDTAFSRDRHHRDRESTATSGGKERRKRKRAGEDDIDFALRVARERIREPVPSSRDGESQKKSTTSNAPLTDAAGHFDLFPQDAPSLTSQKNPEAEKEAARKKKQYEDQYMMRFSNAAGNNTNIASGPWYADGGNIQQRETLGKDAWGNDDPQRKDREAARIVSSDPLAIMKRSAAKVRQVEQQRKVVNEEKERELRQLRREKWREKRRGRDGEDRPREHRRNNGKESRHRHRSERRNRDRDNSSHGSRGDRNHTSRDRRTEGSTRRELVRTDHY